MGNLQIYNCISTIDYFEINSYEDLGIGVEIQDFTEPSLLDVGWEERVDEYKKILEGFSYPISIHGPFLDLKPISPDKTIRSASIDRYLTTLHIGSQLNVDHIIFHSQINPWINEPRMRKLNNSLNMDFWEWILDKTGFEGTILLENVFEDEPMLLMELVDTINLPNIKICLDIGHAKLKGEIEEWVKILKDKIEYLHIHWNDGMYDEHLRPSDENFLYISKILSKYGINPNIALEYDTNDIKDEVNRIIDILY